MSLQWKILYRNAELIHYTFCESFMNLSWERNEPSMSFIRHLMRVSWTLHEPFSTLLGTTGTFFEPFLNHLYFLNLFWIFCVKFVHTNKASQKVHKGFRKYFWNWKLSIWILMTFTDICSRFSTNTSWKTHQTLIQASCSRLLCDI